MFREQALDLLGAYAGEPDIGEDRVMIDGVEYEYTGTRHRDLLYKAYAELIERPRGTGTGQPATCSSADRTNASPS